MNEAAAKIGVVKAPASRMSFANMRIGKMKVPYRLYLFGVEGVGKSTLAANAPKPIFIGADAGTENLDIARLPQPETWSDVFEAVRLVQNEKHDYQTVVFDPMSFLEVLCWDHLCRKHKWADMEAEDYGKCYLAARDEWRLLLLDIERLWTSRQMHVIFIDHARVKMFKNPVADDFERYVPAMHEKSADLFKRWSAFVLFATHDVAIHKDKKKRVRGLSDGTRILKTQWSAAYDAKNRADLPPELPLSWDRFAEAVEASKERETALRQQIADGVKELGDPEVSKKVGGYLAEAGDDVARLAEIANAVSAKLREREESQPATGADGAEENSDESGRWK